MSGVIETRLGAILCLWVITPSREKPSLLYSIPDNINNNLFKSFDVIGRDIAAFSPVPLRFFHISP